MDYEKDSPFFSYDFDFELKNLVLTLKHATFLLKTCFCLVRISFNSGLIWWLVWFEDWIGLTSGLVWKRGFEDWIGLKTGLVWRLDLFKDWIDSKTGLVWILDSSAYRIFIKPGFLQRPTCHIHNSFYNL